MRLVKGTLDNGQLLLDEPVDSTKPMRVVVTFLDEAEKPKERIDFSDWPTLSLGNDSGKTYVREKMSDDDFSNWPMRLRGDDSHTTYSREEIYGDDMR
jgi:hypothetical protein